MKKICVIGGGRWGKNHIRTLNTIGALAAVVESDDAKLKEYCLAYPTIKGYHSVDEALTDGYDGYTVATPAETHFSIGKKLLENGQNVLIEKPLTLSSVDARELVEIAQRNDARLMVGHVLLFHPAIIKIKQLIEQGKIGKLFYLYSNRLNLGTVRTEENVFWSFAPHDISVLDYLVGTHATKVSADGAKFLQEKIYDVTMTRFEYPDGVRAHIFVSWLHPFKEQRLVVVGSKGMLSFDDSSVEKEIHFWNKRIDFIGGVPTKVEEPDEIVEYDRKQPLEEELRYFIGHLDGKIEVADGMSGYEVVKVLETLI